MSYDPEKTVNKDDPLTACTSKGEDWQQHNSQSGTGDFRSDTRAMLAALIVGALLTGLKFYGFWITGSSAILSDALESIINVVAAAFGFVSVIVSHKPADESHPYGHGQIEFFSAGFEGALIMLAAGGVFYEGLRQIFYPLELPNLGPGLLFLVTAAVGNLILAMVLLKIARRTGSLVLEADGKHLMSDVFTSSAVFVGLGAVHYTGWFRLDGIIACVAGANIIFWGTTLVRRAFGGLMHKADPELLDEVCAILAEHKKNKWIDVHRLRAWRSGQRVHIDFHLILPRDLPLEEAHSEVKLIEGLFTKHYKAPDILVHLDPCLDPDCPVCANRICDHRQEDPTQEKEWHRKNLIGDAPSHKRIG
ncbi:cation diffusion facilitator family transporter [Desulfomonile tiedjei]|uniref:Cation diffusion facilitator family transporter n=1 Tax=Desulfomonile tiedjei (strain ATCC 49306 / DSM 6799 / DCB-1) TaxID=706587 RepID=I4C6Z2_DESTA|nr:cation diffusion facilitator family transporter [Desulfomonile tiedjei]AFM25333.1 cation diffusion facilitator family transporter [Desulfomonile tiedjei DSM 6799]